MNKRDEQLEKIISEVVTPCACSTPSDLQMAYIVARDVAQAYKAKLAEQKPVVYRFLHPSTKQYVYLTDNVPKIKEFEPLYANPMPTDHFPDVGKMVAQRQEAVAWRVHPFDYGVGVDGAYAITQQEDQMQAWINKGWEVTPLYLAPTLPLEPSDELITEIKAMADIRLINGKAELSNVREIIHTIAHNLSYAH